jgi:hypothetical protein
MIVAKFDKKYKVIYENYNLRELLRKLEEIAFEFVLQHEVQPEKYFKKTKSGFYKTHKMGYFAVSNWDKITIFEKYIDKGYIYNQIKIRKVITYILIRPERSSVIQGMKESEWDEDKYLEKIALFQNIHKEIDSIFLDGVMLKLTDTDIKSEKDII